MNSDQTKRYQREWAAADRAKNPEKYSKRNRARFVKNPITRMLKSARRRARDKGLEFNITDKDISVPEYCPVLGIKLEVGLGRQHDGSPTLDRIDSTKGYVKGNVEVISNKANRIKNNATLNELLSVVNYYLLRL